MPKELSISQQFAVAVKLGELYADIKDQITICMRLKESGSNEAKHFSGMMKLKLDTIRQCGCYLISDAMVVNKFMTLCDDLDLPQFRRNEK